MALDWAHFSLSEGEEKTWMVHNGLSQRWADRRRCREVVVTGTQETVSPPVRCSNVCWTCFSAPVCYPEKGLRCVCVCVGTAGEITWIGSKQRQWKGCRGLESVKLRLPPTATSGSNTAERFNNSTMVLYLHSGLFWYQAYFLLHVKAMGEYY